MSRDGTLTHNLPASVSMQTGQGLNDCYMSSTRDVEPKRECHDPDLTARSKLQRCAFLNIPYSSI